MVASGKHKELEPAPCSHWSDRPLLPFISSLDPSISKNILQISTAWLCIDMDRILPCAGSGYLRCSSTRKNRLLQNPRRVIRLNPDKQNLKLKRRFSNDVLHVALKKMMICVCPTETYSWSATLSHKSKMREVARPLCLTRK